MSQTKLGIRWPDFDLSVNRKTVGSFVRNVERLGFDHVTVMDHVVGMNNETLGKDSPFHDELAWGESLTMLTYMAGMSDKLGFLTSIFVLPARPTVLVAKQISTLDCLTEGRLRLGVSIGWNQVEYKMLGADFNNRAARYEEQIELLRKFWTKSPITYDGTWHQIPEVTMEPLPQQQPVPIWMGMSYKPPLRVFKRIGRLADGFLPPWQPGDEAKRYICQIQEEIAGAGRDPKTVGFEGRINLRVGSGQVPGTLARKSNDELADQVGLWKEIGASHIEFKTRRCGVRGLNEHLDVVANFKSVADTVLG